MKPDGTRYSQEELYDKLWIAIEQLRLASESLGGSSVAKDINQIHTEFLKEFRSFSSEQREEETIWLTLNYVAIRLDTFLKNVQDERLSKNELFIKAAKKLRSIRTDGLTYLPANYFGKVKTMNLLGKGSFGAVYQARYGESRCALKESEILVGKERSHLGSIAVEAMLLQRCNSPNIIRLFGVFDDAGKNYLILELMQTSLYDHIQGNSDDDDWPHATKFNVMSQIASGVAYLHQQGFVHRDLHLKNILLNRPFQVKICDLGLAKKNDDPDHFRPNEWNSYHDRMLWLGYDVVYDSSSDVYTIGIILWLIFLWLRHVPVDCFTDLSSLPFHISHLPQAVQALLKDCWSNERKKRPSAAGLVASFNELTTAHSTGSPVTRWNDIANLAKEFFSRISPTLFLRRYVTSRGVQSVSAESLPSRRSVAVK